MQLRQAFASFCLKRDVNENDIKILAFDRGPDYITGNLEYQGVEIPMKIEIPSFTDVNRYVVTP